MKREEDLLLYMKCWREMQIFLSEVVRDDAEGYPYAQDILELMRAIELKMEGEDGTSSYSLDFSCSNRLKVVFKKFVYFNDNRSHDLIHSNHVSHAI